MARHGRRCAAAGTTLTARLLYLGAGYYDYDDPYDPSSPTSRQFGGQVVHPQFWPQDLDYDRQARGGDRLGRDRGDDRPGDGRQGART